LPLEGGAGEGNLKYVRLHFLRDGLRHGYQPLVLKETPCIIRFASPYPSVGRKRSRPLGRLQCLTPLKARKGRSQLLRARPAPFEAATLRRH
jgi:hypothetical protein